MKKRTLLAGVTALALVAFRAELRALNAMCVPLDTVLDNPAQRCPPTSVSGNQAARSA